MPKVPTESSQLDMSAKLNMSLDDIIKSNNSTNKLPKNPNRSLTTKKSKETKVEMIKKSGSNKGSVQDGGRKIELFTSHFHSDRAKTKGNGNGKADISLTSQGRWKKNADVDNLSKNYSKLDISKRSPSPVNRTMNRRGTLPPREQRRPYDRSPVRDPRISRNNMNRYESPSPRTMPVAKAPTRPEIRISDFGKYTSVLLGNLNPKLDDEMVRAWIQNDFEVVSVKLLYYASGEKSRFAEVVFKNENDAESFLRDNRNLELDECRMTLTIVENGPKQN